MDLKSQFAGSSRLGPGGRYALEELKAPKTEKFLNIDGVTFRFLSGDHTLSCLWPRNPESYRNLQANYKENGADKVEFKMVSDGPGRADSNHSDPFFNFFVRGMGINLGLAPIKEFSGIEVAWQICGQLRPQIDQTRRMPELVVNVFTPRCEKGTSDSWLWIHAKIMPLISDSEIPNFSVRDIALRTEAGICGPRSTEEYLMAIAHSLNVRIEIGCLRAAGLSEAQLKSAYAMSIGLLVGAYARGIALAKVEVEFAK